MQNRTPSWSKQCATALGLGLALIMSTTRAMADDKQACLESYDKAQTVRQEGKLIAAREALLVCVRNVCPAIIRRDCTQWLSEVDEAQPSVVIEARKPDGQDAEAVTVTVDGKPFVSQIDGKAVPIDPGVHAFRFELEGAEPIEQRIVIHEAVKNRRISVEFKTVGQETEPDRKDETGTAGGATATGQDKGAGVKPPAVAYVLGGLGLVGIGGFTYFGLQFDGKLDDMDKCSPNCPQADADDASKTRLFALISGGVGVVSLGVATYLFLAPPGTSKASAEVGRAPMIDVLPVTGGAVGTVRGVF